MPVVSVIDLPGIPEKKSFPPRLLLTALITLIGVGGDVGLVVFRHRWEIGGRADPRKNAWRGTCAATRAEGSAAAQWNIETRRL